MIYLGIGLVTGLVMGLTGAGGALVALPLFLEFLHLNLKEASVLSLIAVVIAAGMNYLFQRKHADLRLALLLLLPSALGSFLSAQFKDSLPLGVMKFLLISISLLALIGVWKPFPAHSGRMNVHISITAISGFILGVITTFTGLGGGVLLLPLLLNLYHLPMQQAVPTSLIVISLSSLASLLIQAGQVSAHVNLSDMAILSGGIILSGFTFLILVRFMKPEILHRIRQIVFSLVVIIAVVKIFYGK